MNTTKWFDRKFVFDKTAADFPALYDRLVASPPLLQEIITNADEDIICQKPDGKWSVKEHIGHLVILEALWQERINDITNGHTHLTVADLDNKATSTAEFNRIPINELVARFSEIRGNTLKLLQTTDVAAISTKSRHPRMLQDLGLTDHLYFVAEHDDHHLNYIRLFLNQRTR